MKNQKLKITIILTLVIMCILSACGRQEEFTEEELLNEKAAVQEYLNHKYPGHEFDVSVTSSVHGGTGLPTYLDLDRYAVDENGVEFNIYYTFNQDDPIILQFLKKYYTDDYEDILANG